MGKETRFGTCDFCWLALDEEKRFKCKYDQDGTSNSSTHICIYKHMHVFHICSHLSIAAVLENVAYLNCAPKTELL